MDLKMYFQSCYVVKGPFSACYFLLLIARLLKPFTSLHGYVAHLLANEVEALSHTFSSSCFFLSALDCYCQLRTLLQIHIILQHLEKLRELMKVPNFQLYQNLTDSCMSLSSLIITKLFSRCRNLSQFQNGISTYHSRDDFIQI